MGQRIVDGEDRGLDLAELIEKLVAQIDAGGRRLVGR